MTHVPVVNAPDPKVMSLEVLEPALRIVARLAECLGVVAEERQSSRPIRSLAFVVAVVLELHRVMAVHGPVARKAISRLEYQRLILAKQVVRVSIDDVRDAS